MTYLCADEGTESLNLLAQSQHDFVGLGEGTMSLTLTTVA